VIRVFELSADIWRIEAENIFSGMKSQSNSFNRDERNKSKLSTFLFVSSVVPLDSPKTEPGAINISDWDASSLKSSYQKNALLNKVLHRWIN